jgi:hypothetical protein
MFESFTLLEIVLFAIELTPLIIDPINPIVPRGPEKKHKTVLPIDTKFVTIPTPLEVFDRKSFPFIFLID